MSKIKVKNLYKIFGKNPHKAVKLLREGQSKEEILKENQVVALQEVSFSIEVGEIFVVMGLSGSGKSTLVRCLNRLIESTTGEIYIDKENVTEMTPQQLLQLRRKKLAMVFQSFALFPHINVLDNVAYGLKVQGVVKKEREQKARKALETVGLQGWETSYPEQLSGGMRQRVGLARALANDPDILLMDEAFSALDPLIRSDLQDELLALQSRMNKTIVFITHDLDEALKLGDRIALMKDGKIVQIGTTEEILSSPANEYVARFVEGVDKTRVLTASQVMKKPEPVVFLKDGPRVALRRMKEYGISSIFVVDRNYKLKGLLPVEKAVEAVRTEKITLDSLVDTEIPRVSPDTSVYDMFALMQAGGPVAVTSPDDELLGIIVRGSVFAGLAGNEVNNVE